MYSSWIELLMNVMSFAIKVPLKHNTSPNMK